MTDTDRESMRREAEQIAQSHPAVASSVDGFWDGQAIAPLGQVAPPVIVTLPPGITDEPLQILVRHQPWGVEVDVRVDRHRSWTPLSFFTDASFEVRDR